MTLRCNNASCPFLRKHGVAATYRAGVATCADCGGPLVEQAEQGSAMPVAVPGVSSPSSRGARVVLLPTLATAALLAATVALGLVPLPWVDAELFGALGEGGDAPLLRLQPLSLAALGVAPWISAALLVEIAAALVPRWRPLRSFAGRGRLSAAADRLGVVLAALQALMLLQWVGSLELSGMYVLDAEGFGPRAVVVATLLAGAVLVRLAAQLIDARGLGGGMTLLVSVPLLLSVGGGGLSLLQAVRDDVRPAIDLALWLVVVAGAGGAALLVRPAPDDERPAMPVAGALPLAWSAAAVQLGSSLLPLFNLSPVPMAALLVVQAACAVVLTVGVGRALHLRSASFGRALPPSIGFVLALAALAGFATWRGVGLDALAVVVLVCVGRDLAGELTLRRELGPLARALTASSLAEAQRTQARLASAGVAAHVRAAHHRALWHFFGPHLSLDLLVAEADLERARALASAPVEGASTC